MMWTTSLKPLFDTRLQFNFLYWPPNYFHFSTFLLFIISLFPKSTISMSSKELCLNKVCSGCIAGSLSCQEGGLSNLPDRLSADIQSMIFIGHRFDNPKLMSVNFSSYSQQNVQLQRLTLRNCGIQNIQPGTFKSLQSLQQLDLSQNHIKSIDKGTFSGLQLEFLRLDENRGLQIGPGAFQDVTIVSLSLTQCGLTKLTYEDLAPLISNKQLSNLDISGNQLFTLESRLEPAFLQLQTLSLEQNPFRCDCKLSWLSEVLQRRQVRRRTRALALSNNARDFSQGMDSLNSDFDVSRSAPLDGDLLKPLCHSPRRLGGRTLESLTPSDFYCGTPQLKILEVDLSQLTDSQVEDGSEPHNSKKDVLTVTLRCFVKGSPELQVSWFRRAYKETDTSLYPNATDLFHELTPIPHTRVLDAGSVEVKLTRPSNTLPKKTSVNKISAKHSERLICLASDSNGNTSAEIMLHWPNLDYPQSSKVKVIHPNPIERFSIKRSDENDKPSNTEPVVTSGKQDRSNQDFTNGWYKIIQDDQDSFLFQKQFSVLEMIGAVVGTFTVTLTLFVFGCCLLRIHRQHRDKVRSKILLHHTASQNSYNHSSPASENLKPPVYSSNCVRTVVTTASGTLQFSGMNPTNLNPTMSPSVTGQSVNVNSGNEHPYSLNEFNGGRRFPYSSYDPGDPNTSTTYSESQTYDLPQIPPTHSPPTIPLPPLPPSFLTNSTAAVPLNLPVGIERDETRVPFLMSTLPYSPENDSNRGINATILSPMFLNNPTNIPVAISAAATLTRLRHHQPSPMNGAVNQQQLAAAAAVQNQIIDFVNRQSLINQQFQDSQLGGTNRSTYDSPTLESTN